MTRYDVTVTDVVNGVMHKINVVEALYPLITSLFVGMAVMNFIFAVFLYECSRFTSARYSKLEFSKWNVRCVSTSYG